MEIKPFKRVIGGTCLFILAFFWPAAGLGTSSPESAPEQGLLSRVISVRAKTAEKETIVTVEGNGIIPEYLDQTFAEPPRIVIDLLCAAQGFETQTVDLDDGILQRVRVGHHPDRIRIVLDVKHLPLPAFSLRKENHVLHVAVSHDGPSAPHETEGQGFGEAEKIVEAHGGADFLKEPPPEISSTASPRRRDKGTDETKNTQSRPEELLDASALDHETDALLFRAGVQAFREERWMKAIESFTALLDKHPGGPYEERASFLLARSYEHLMEPSESTHFTVVRGRYEDFLTRFPSSGYAAEALTAIGRLCFQIGYHTEAMGYYGLAFSRDKNSPAAAEALEGQMKIHVLKRRFDEALTISRHILEHYPGSANAADVRMERARILHELNRFQESLTVLSGLQREGVRSAYVRPEISLYAGYNAYQLGNFPMARENLFRFCNVNPRADEIPIALTRIGDAYRDERQLGAAAKLYRLVAEHYPDTEGVLISQIRLAELQEQEQETEREKGLGFGAEPGERIPSPREVYETMLQSAGLKEAKNPLMALALLKLAVIYQEEEDYAKSLAMVNQLMERFPGQQLQKETGHVLLKTLEGMVAGSVEAGEYYRAIGLYYEEKDLFFKVESPDLYMAIARVFLKIDLRDDAIALFKKAGFLLLDEEKPADLLYFSGLDLYRKNAADEALDKLQAAIKKGGDPEAVSRAYFLTGRIMGERRQRGKALEALAAALKPVSDPCMHLEILTETASVQAAGGMNAGALKTAQKAVRLSAACRRPPLFVHENLAGVFTSLGRPDEAAAVLEEGAGKEEIGEGRERVRWKLAQTYERQGKREESLSLYRDLANLGDPLWRGLASEKIEEIRFLQEMESLRKK